MKLRKTNPLKSFLFSLLGLSLLLAPMLVELVHVLSKFHTATEYCTDTSAIHLSEDELDCSICNSHLSLYSFESLDIEFITTITDFPTIFLFKRALIKQQAVTHYQLRAPPFFV